ncbi:M48 family metallopeptidase [bacterium]|nr:M48 family metallopeptidase [candidate division CSSED10-310 bacterium]
MWELIRANRRKSVFLVVIMAALLFVVGYAAGELLIGQGGGVIGLFFAFAVWIIMTLVAYFQGRQIFMTVSGAQKIKKEDHPQLWNVVEEMVIASQLPKIPDIYIIDDPAPNAFAAGRNPANAAVAVTTGLLNRLKRDELQGVIAHEIGHVKNRDILFMTMIGVMLGAIVLITDIAVRSMFYGGHRRRSRTASSGGSQFELIILVAGIVLMILAPLLAHLIYLAASRKREYLADASSAQFTRFPEGLALALEKIAHTPIKMKKINRVTAPMYTVNPLQKASAKAAGLFSTHPPIGERVKILRSMAGGSTYMAYNEAFQQITGSRSSIVPQSALISPESRPAGTAPPGPVPGLRQMEGAALLAAAVPEPATQAGKVRQTTDALWKARNYRFIHCDCGAVLKVPPDFKRREFKCLRCKKVHSA